MKSEEDTRPRTIYVSGKIHADKAGSSSRHSESRPFRSDNTYWAVHPFFPMARFALGGWDT